MTLTTFKDHFSSGSENYAAHQPTYPIELIDKLANISPGHGLAFDCGCGTGQLNVLLAERFDKVVATDASAAQIEMAQPREGVTYRTALAEDSDLPDASVDLITAAQAAHWLDLDDEVRRVARPNAAIALITYGMLHVEGSVDPIIQHFYYYTIGPYWPCRAASHRRGVSEPSFPFQGESASKAGDQSVLGGWKALWVTSIRGRP